MIRQVVFLNLINDAKEEGERKKIPRQVAWFTSPCEISDPFMMTFWVFLYIHIILTLVQP